MSHFAKPPGPGLDDDKTLLMSQMRLEQRFGQSDIFVASTLTEYGGVPLYATPEKLIKEAIHVISCGYQDTTEWGTEVFLPTLFLTYPWFDFSNLLSSVYWFFRLGGYMVLLQKISSPVSKCMHVAGGRFTVCLNYLHSKDLLQSIFLIDWTKSLGGL